MGYNPREQPEMAKITSFVDASRVVYHGSQCIEILSGLKILSYNPRKRLEMAEITSFADASRVVYQGSQGIQIFPGSKNRGL